MYTQHTWWGVFFSFFFFFRTRQMKLVEILGLVGEIYISIYLLIILIIRRCDKKHFSRTGVKSTWEFVNDYNHYFWFTVDWEVLLALKCAFFFCERVFGLMTWSNNKLHESFLVAFWIYSWCVAEGGFIVWYFL